jgi:hypothetical protein
MAKDSTDHKSNASLEEEPDYDQVPRDEFSPMWMIAIALGILLAAFGAIIAFS